MFPARQNQRAMHPYPLFPMRSPIESQQNTTKGKLMSLIQDTEGNLDLEKITATAQQINQIYGQVSPMISRFIKK